MRVTDEMVKAASNAVRRVTGGAFTPSGLLLREAIEAALAAAPPCEYIRSTGEGTHHCALATAPDDKLREAARNALKAWDTYGTAECLRGWIDIMRAALGGSEVTRDDICATQQITFPLPPKPVGFWVLYPGAVMQTKFGMYQRPTDEQIKATEQLLGWGWEDAK